MIPKNPKLTNPNVHSMNTRKFHGRGIDVGRCLGLKETGIRTALIKMTAKQVVKLTNSKVVLNNFRKLNNTGENFINDLMKMKEACR